MHAFLFARSASHQLAISNKHNCGLIADLSAERYFLAILKVPHRI